MAKETVQEKALRYIAEGRVQVVSVTPTSAEVHIQGSRKEPYIARFRGGAWDCDCEARVECAHLSASRLIVKLAPSEPQLFQSEDTLDAFLKI